MFSFFTSFFIYLPGRIFSHRVHREKKPHREHRVFKISVFSAGKKISHRVHREKKPTENTESLKSLYSLCSLCILCVLCGKFFPARENGNFLRKFYYTFDNALVPLL
jgi:hypothetical protein